MHFSLGGRLAVNGIQLGTQQLIITAVAVADPRLTHWLLVVQTPSGNKYAMIEAGACFFILNNTPPLEKNVFVFKRAHLRNR